MHDGNAFAFECVNNDVSVLNLGLLVEKQDIAAVHAGLHAAGKHHDYGRLGPEGEFEAVPDHDCAHHDDAEGDALEDDLQSQRMGLPCAASFAAATQSCQ